MKKSVIAAILISFVFILTSFTPVFAANVPPIVLDWSKADTEELVLHDPCKSWDETIVGKSEYDPEAGAWKITTDQVISSPDCAYTSVTFDIAPMLEQYKFVRICYKTSIDYKNDILKFRRSGTVWATINMKQSDDFASVVLNLSEVDSFVNNRNLEAVGITIGPEGKNTEMQSGATVWIKYIALFGTKEEADSFRIDGETARDPETSYVEEPESSEEPSSSTEVSESSVSESSVSESSSSEQSDPGEKNSSVTVYVIIAAVVIVAAVLAIVLTKKKK
ncbi:MAG: hypothetical protein J5874_06870 [Oscillospiraceae bacterium]|nr:hypothetical protein [Oscillospiraceae bacterium]